MRHRWVDIMSDEEPRREVAAALAARETSWPERHMAAVAAATRGRYEALQ
jgi:hypothetical protein